MDYIFHDFHVRVAIVWWVEMNKHVHDDAGAPQITSKAIKSLNFLWCKVVRRAPQICEQHGLLLNLGSASKVSDLELAVSFARWPIYEENVFRLDISMHYAILS